MTRPGIPRPRFGEEWLIAVLDSLSEGVVALDRSGSIIAANPAAERMLRFDLATHRYAHWGILPWGTLVDASGDPVDHEQHPVASALNSRQGQIPRVFGMQGAEGTCWLQLATHVLAAAGGLAPDGVVVSFQDVTDRVTAEHDRERLMTLQREMLAAASHDLRNPLAVVAGTVEILLKDWDDLDDESRLAGVATIERQVGRLDRLVSDLALVARLEGGGLVADPRRVAVTELIDVALDGLAGSPDIQVAVDAALTVWVDVEHGRRMLLNLVDNACKHGDPPVLVEAVRVEDSVAITVSDHGPGVPSEFVDHLFDRFTRADPRGGVGMGLGLAIVDRLALLNRGTATYRQAAGGACFELRLPAEGQPARPDQGRSSG